MLLFDFNVVDFNFGSKLLVYLLTVVFTVMVKAFIINYEAYF